MPKKSLQKHGSKKENKTIVFNIDIDSAKKCVSDEHAIKQAFQELKNLIDKHKCSDEQKNDLDNLAVRFSNYLLIFPVDFNYNAYSFKLTKRNIDLLCNNYSIGIRYKNLVKRIKQAKHSNPSYLVQANKCFQKGLYLPCSLLLLAVIDCEFLSTFKNESGRKLNIKHKTLEQYFAPKIKNEKYDFLYFYAKLLYCLLDKIFSDGANFENEPDCINRNYLAHGMSKRYVKKLECIKLMFIIDNLFLFE